MKVGGINSINTPIKREQKASPTFHGKGDFNQLGDQIAKFQKWIPRTLAYIGQNDGEILNTVVTAVGTAGVAPIFIALNPFSKEDKETKYYTAGRQPISAVTALVMQLSVNTLFNNWMSAIASTGLLKRADLSAMPDKKYLKRIIKLEHPEYNKDQITAEIIKRQTIAERTAISKLRNSLKDTNIQTSELICKDLLDVAEKQLTNEYKTANSEKIAGLKGKKLQKHLKENIPQEKIQERAIQNLEKDLELKAKTKFEVRELAKKFTNIDEAIKSITEKLTSSPEEKDILNNILDRLDTVKTYEEKNNLKSFSSIKNIGESYEEILHNVKVKQMVKSRTADAKIVLSKYRNQLGIIVSLVTLPISCGMLNWLYPRIMEDVMPSIRKWIHRNDNCEMTKEVKNG